jgi:hypothetical protein
MPLKKHKTSKQTLSEGHRRKFDSILSALLSYLSTEDGAGVFDQMQNLFIRIEERRTLELLTTQEMQALQFIRTELQFGRHLSVRKVTQALGFKSSRTGFRVIEALIRKNVLTRASGRLLLKDIAATDCSF